MKNDTGICYKCGFCCTQGPCGYGEWDKDRKCCKYLEEPNGYLQRFCRKYKEIIRNEAKSSMPMMACGCSSRMFNDMREAVIKKLEEKV